MGKGFSFFPSQDLKGTYNCFEVRGLKEKQMPFHRMHSYNLEFIAKKWRPEIKTALSRSRC